MFFYNDTRGALETRIRRLLDTSSGWVEDPPSRTTRMISGVRVFATDITDEFRVDTGPDPAELTRCLRELGVRRVPLIVLTHLHADHSGGLAAVTGEASVVPGDTRQHLLASAATTPEEGFRSLTRASVGAEQKAVTQQE